MSLFEGLQNLKDSMTPEERKMVEEASRRVDEKNRLAKREELATAIYLDMISRTLADSSWPNFDKVANNAIMAAEALMKALANGND